MAVPVPSLGRVSGFVQLGCSGVFPDVSIIAMSPEFEPDSFDAGEPNEPPPALMRKRRHPIVWIGLALLLGAIIALFLAALVTD
jgi:hypothetical protein